MESKRKNLRKNRGITLIALVITIIILLILAGISIAQLTGTGIFAKAKEAKAKYKNAEELENQTLAEYERMLNNLGGSSSSGSGGGESEQGDQPTPSNPTEPATSMEEAKKDDMFDKTVNSTVKDEYDNQVVIPAGFKIPEDSGSNVTEGIVIKDKNDNEFVWIPVGTVTGTDKQQHTIELSRYTFAEDGKEKNEGEGTISNYYEELAESTKGNTTAKELKKFKTSATNNHGYYIGRYEARTVTERKAEGDELKTVTEKESDFVYNYVTQPQASQQCQAMYTDEGNFTSDLMNSYAWDTAIVFLQTFGDNKTYSRKTSVNSSLAKTGTNNTETKDVECNIYDMASNMWEWTTETSAYSSNPCTYRGGLYDSTSYTSVRFSNSTTVSRSDIGFRPLLYCSTER